MHAALWYYALTIGSRCGETHSRFVEFTETGVTKQPFDPITSKIIKSDVLSERDIPRVAVCLTGRLTDFVGTTGPSTDKWFLDQIGERYDLFVYAPLENETSSGHSYILKHPRLRQARIVKEDCSGEFDASINSLRKSDWEKQNLRENIRSIPGNWIAGLDGEHRRGNGLCQMWAQNNCLEMIEAAEARNQKRYDIVSFSRLDSYWIAPHVPFWLLEWFMHHVELYIPVGENWGGYNDKHAVFSRRCADYYLGGWRLLVTGKATDQIFPLHIDSVTLRDARADPTQDQMVNQELYLNIRMAHHKCQSYFIPATAYIPCTANDNFNQSCYRTGAEVLTPIGAKYEVDFVHAKMTYNCLKNIVRSKRWTLFALQQCFCKHMENFYILAMFCSPISDWHRLDNKTFPNVPYDIIPLHGPDVNIEDVFNLQSVIHSNAFAKFTQEPFLEAGSYEVDV